MLSIGLKVRALYRVVLRGCLDACSETGWFHIDEVNIFLWDHGGRSRTYLKDCL